MSIRDDIKRYLAACHAMQSGVAMQMNFDGGAFTGAASPKHLRVGVNSAMVQSSALVRLLIDKGVFTEEEWTRTLADTMEAEVDMYRQELAEHTNVDPERIHLV